MMGLANNRTFIGPGDSSTMERVIIENAWKTAWAKTNTIGKQVMLQHLSDVINDEAASHPGMPRFSNDEKMLAEASLRALLAMTENEQLEQPIDELKAATTHQLMALTALMIHNAPKCSLTPIVVNFIYGKAGDESLAHMAKQWRDTAAQGRLACFYAARVLQAVKSNNCTHFGTPVSLLKAVFILWIYSMLADRFQDGFLSPRPAPTVVLGPKALAGMEMTDWVESGWNRVKLPGISNLLCSEGRRNSHPLLRLTGHYLWKGNISRDWSLIMLDVSDTDTMALAASAPPVPSTPTGTAIYGPIPG
ncbi:Zinc finger protein rst2 [Ilyonectria robusta]